MSEASAAPEATRTASITDELRRLIQTGEVAPGTRLVQADVAKRFGTSITPVREAFSALARVGLIRQDARRSAVVVRPSPKDMRDNLEIRLQLEPLAAARASERISDDDIARLTEVLAVANPEGDQLVHHATDRAFHEIINRASGNAQLADIVGALRDAAYVYLQFDGPRVTPRQISQLHGEHQAILEALRAGEAVAAEREMRRHLRGVVRRSLDIL